MQQGNRHCTANIRNTRAHSSRRWRIRKRRNRTLQVVGRFLTLFVLTLVLAVGIMLSGAALLGWWPSKEIPRQENSASTPLLTPAQTPEPLTVDVSGINSPYALLMCRDGTELGQESADASIYPASMTKIMTVLLGVENIPDLDAEVTLDPDIFNDLWAENASMAGFAPGETVTVRDILYGSLLPSGAECSVTIAQLVDSGVEAFANRMNNRAAEIGMQHTHFTNPTGLHDPEHVSTVRDIAMLLNTALENPTFREIFTTRSYTTTSTDAHPGGIQLYSRMFSMLGDRVIPGVTLLGGKTGFTDLAGQCLASLAECGGEEYILVTAGAPSNNDEDLYNKIHLALEETPNRCLTLLTTLFSTVRLTTQLIGITILIANYNVLILLVCIVTSIPMLRLSNRVGKFWYTVGAERAEGLRKCNRLKELLVEYNNIKEIKLFDILNL